MSKKAPIFCLVSLMLVGCGTYSGNNSGAGGGNYAAVLPGEEAGRRATSIVRRAQLLQRIGCVDFAQNHLRLCQALVADGIVPFK